jgi:hypothetical protein
LGIQGLLRVPEEAARQEPYTFVVLTRGSSTQENARTSATAANNILKREPDSLKVEHARSQSYDEGFTSHRFAEAASQQAAAALWCPAK